MASVTTTPSSGIVAKTTVLRVTCASTPNNDTSDFDAAEYPTEPEIQYYFKLSIATHDDLVSNVFSTNSAGVAEWNGVLLPVAGTWTLDACLVEDDSVAATASVVAS